MATLEIGHSLRCRHLNSGRPMDAEYVCGGSGFCDYARAQELAARVEELEKLLNPAVVQAARMMAEHNNNHPAACCGHCAKGLAELETLRGLIKTLKETRDVFDGKHVINKADMGAFAKAESDAIGAIIAALPKESE